MEFDIFSKQNFNVDALELINWLNLKVAVIIAALKLQKYIKQMISLEQIYFLE